jgi:23S rRNA pseudouridine955/2504/2580 synthase
MPRGMKEIPLLFENDDCMVFNKPAGLPTQGGAGIAVSLDSILAERWNPRPLLVHRLDRDTSGLILVARGREAAARFSRLFAREGSGGPEGGALTKQYLAVCAGRPPKPEGRISGDIALRGPPKKSLTAYKLIAGDGEYSLLELALFTGRTHQIRRHLAQNGVPVLGDDKYGNFALNRRLRKTLGLRHLLLHASRLIIPGVLDLSAPLPDYFTPFLERWR